METLEAPTGEQKAGGEWRAVRDAQLPTETEMLLRTVPEWFGRDDANADYVESAKTMETWTVRDLKDKVVGLMLVARHFAHVAEIHLMVVARDNHGSGVGSALVRALEDDSIRSGVRLLEVKTLGPSDPNPEYAQTRRFYESCGFLALEETELWGAGTPCLIMVKPVAA